MTLESTDSARPGTGETPPAAARYWPAAALTVLVLIYLATVLPSIGNDPIAGGDEGWIISSSAKLAHQGEFGTDLFAGFYGAEDHYFFNLPLHHLILAAVFKVAGVSLTVGRLVSAVFGVVALALTYLLGKRIGRTLVGLGAAGLLVLLRLNLAPFSGLTLTDLGATVRYDLITLPFSIGAVLLALRLNDRPSLLLAAATGFVTALGALTQFIGAFVAVPIGIFLLTLPVETKRRLLLTAVYGAAFVLPFLPYATYATSDWTDFRGQVRAGDRETVGNADSALGRDDFLSPSFYWQQLRDEHERYEIATGLGDFPTTVSELAEKPSARIVLLILGPLAALYMLVRGRRDRPRFLIGLTILCLVVELALFDSTKRFVYWVVVVPYLCVALADMALWVWQRATDLDERRRFVVRAAVAAVVVLFLLEGLGLAAGDVRDARDAPDYAALGGELREVLPADAVVLGDNRLWPALDDRQLRGLLLLFYHTNPDISEERTTSVTGALDRIGADYVLLSPLSREMLDHLTPRDKAEFERFMAERTELVDTMEARAYGPIEVYRVRR